MTRPDPSTPIDPATRLAVCESAARAGGEVLRRYRRDGVTIRNKSDVGGKTYDLVSDADLDSERAVASEIRRAFPDDELIGEEGLDGDPAAEHLWIIDPLDGTNNYAHGLDHYAVSIAYYHRGVAVAGAVHNPARDEMYTATRGGGAWFDGRRRSVADESTLDGVLVGCGFYYDRGRVMRQTLTAIERLFGADIHGIRRIGTASLDLIMVGLGNYGAFFEYQLAPWDFAAGRLFVEEAGGRVTTTDGDDLPIAKTSLLATNGRLHAAMIDAVRRD